MTLIGLYLRSCVRQMSRRPSSHVANAWQHVSRHVASNSYKWCDATWHETCSYAAYCEQGPRNSKITLAIYGTILALCNDHSTLWQVRKLKQWLLTYTLKLVLGRMFHYLNICLFATAFEYMKLHSKVWPRLHPAITGHVPLLLHAKNFTKVPFLSKQELNFVPRLGQSFVMKICNRQKVSKWTSRKCELENTHETNIRTFVHFDGQMFECKNQHSSQL